MKSLDFFLGGLNLSAVCWQPYLKSNLFIGLARLLTDEIIQYIAIFYHNLILLLLSCLDFQAHAIIVVSVLTTPLLPYFIFSTHFTPIIY